MGQARCPISCVLIAVGLCSGLGLSAGAADPAGGALAPAADEPRMVIVEGVGINVEEARRDAYRQAVRQVLGAIVDAKTLVENDQLITDKVVVFSDGFIERVEPLADGEVRDTGGLVRLRLKAFVKAGRLAESLRTNAISVAAPVVAINDADSLLARVTTTQERAREARELFLAAAKGFPADCFQAEAFPLTDANVRVKDDVVECDVRVKVTARPKEYEEFAKRLIAFVETLPPEAEKVIHLPNPARIVRKPLATEEQHLEGLAIDARLLFPDTALAQAFDRVGQNPLLDFGQRIAMGGGLEAQQAFQLKEHDLLKRTGRFGFRLSVIPNGTAPYHEQSFLIDEVKMAWFGELHGCMRCSVAFFRGGKTVAETSTRLKQFGIGVAPHLTGTDWRKALTDRGRPLRDASVVPGYAVGRSFGPTCEFTLPVRVPAAEFTKGLQLRCTLTNQANAAP